MTLLLLLLACEGGDATDTGGSADGGADGGGACGLLGELALPARAAPGQAVATGLAVDPAATLEFEASLGEVSADGQVWTLPADVAVHTDERATLEVRAAAPGCPDELVSGALDVGWEEVDRVVVLYNPALEGSDTVARAYAALHDLPEDQLCGVASDATVTLPGDELPTFVGALQACLDRVGPQVHYLVPVWGVPYKVSDRIDDISGSGAKATVSLDALLALPDEAVSLSGAIYNPLYQDGDSLAGAYDPWVPIGQLRDELGYRALLVSRIDGLDADAAIALVDRAEQAAALAATGALDGIVYVDGRYGDSPPATDEFGSYESGEWNMWGTRALFEALGWYEVVWDGNAEEFGTEPAPTACPDALYYAGWYSYYNYNDCFTWAPGAIGGHLDSCSACDLRATGTWSGSALADGISFTFGAVNEPYVAGMPEYDQLFLYLSQGASFGEAAYESTVVGAWMMVWVGDPLYRPYPQP